MAEAGDPQLWAWDVMYQLGGILAEDDLEDFSHFIHGRPHPDPTHGPLHHWQAGVGLQLLSLLMGFARVGEIAAEGFQKTDVDEVLEYAEKIAYPL